MPWSSAQALENNYGRWMDANGCPRCVAENRGAGPKARYVKDNSCSFCFAKDYHLVFEGWKQGDPGRPDPWSTDIPTSTKFGIDYYFGSPNHDLVCKNGPHIRRTSIVNGRCLDCEIDRAEMRAVLKGPRAAARSAGLITYTPTDPCPSCGTLAQRNVSTNACMSCHNTKSPRAAARAAGFKSYTPTDPCPSCGTLAQRNVITNACAGCSRNNSPRALARAAGLKVYTPTDTCPACGTLAQRNVITNACAGCHDDGRRSASQIFAEQNPDLIMSKEDAAALGFTLYRTGTFCRRGHTGWRYVSTGNCLECLR